VKVKHEALFRLEGIRLGTSFQQSTASVAGVTATITTTPDYLATRSTRPACSNNSYSRVA
jgi:hypothetical protein